MPDTPIDWRYIHFGLVVTGDGEREFLCEMFRVLAATGHATFEVIYKAGQRKGLADKRIDEYGKSGKIIPDRDAEVAYVIRRYVANSEFYYCLWVDDLESSERIDAENKVGRLIRALDAVMSMHPELRNRCSVHMLVNMLEAYYFAHIESVNCVLALDLKPHAGDCESLVHPKNELKKLAGRGGFDEKEHGSSIVASLDLQQILSNPAHCRALRTLVAWCWEAMGLSRGEQFCLSNGVYWNVTAGQLHERPPEAQIGPLAGEESYSPANE